MTEKIRIGMIGTSWWADQMHLPSLTSHPHSVVAAITGRGREAAGARANKYSITKIYFSASGHMQTRKSYED